MRTVNVVLTASLGCPVDLKHVTNSQRHIVYDPKKFPGVIWKECQGACCLLFRSGKIVSCGASSIAQGKRLVRQYARLIQKLNYPVTLTDIKVQTMTAAHTMGKRVYLEKLHSFLSPESDYSPEIFPGLIYKASKKSATVFHNGKIIISGGRCERDLEDFFNELICAIYLSNAIE